MKSVTLPLEFYKRRNKGHAVFLFLPENWRSVIPVPATDDDVLMPDVPLNPGRLTPGTAIPVRPSRLVLLLEPVLLSPAVPCPMLPSPVSCDPPEFHVLVLP